MFQGKGGCGWFSGFFLKPTSMATIVQTNMAIQARFLQGRQQFPAQEQLFDSHSP